jgi:hypothetical protein
MKKEPEVLIRKIRSISASIVILLVLISCSTVHSQYITDGFLSLDTPVDPQSVAMGESFTAARGIPGAFKYNPACLTNLQGINFSYNLRNYDYYKDFNVKYRSYQLSLPVSDGGIGIFYDNYILDVNSSVSTGNNPEAPEEVERNRMMNYVCGITYARTISSLFDLGISVKSYNSSNETSLNGAPLSKVFDYQAAYLLDLGILYHQAGPLTRTDYFDDEFSAGLSLQNFGSDYREKFYMLGFALIPVDANDSLLAKATLFDNLVKLPRYARAGFSYKLSILNEDRGSAAPFSFLFTAEYRNLLNGTGLQLSARDYWGFGAEATFYEMLSLRIGGFIQPAGELYGMKGVPSLRYGAGLNLPLRKIGIDVPFTLHGDYAGIPLHNYFGETTTFKLYSIGITYNNSLF